MLEQKGEGLVDGRGRVNRVAFYNMVIVKDENEIVREGGDLIEQSCQDHFGRRRLMGL